MQAVRVLFLDLDGTVRKGFDELGRFVNTKEDVEVFPEVPKRIADYKAHGFRIVGITNQGGVSLGHLTIKNLKDNIYETNKQCNEAFDLILACRHHPDAKELENAVCWCRKPLIGNIVTAGYELNKKYPNEYYPPHMALFVGDRIEDEQCAKNANIKFIEAFRWREL